MGHAGVGALHGYLEYAKNNGVFLEESRGTGEVESEFELSVRDALEAHGYTVDSNVGFSGFRIDLAIHHPKVPTRYVLGVECDGAAYHSHKTARERDRLRQEVLEGLGWKIYRIWSTDWIRNPENALSRLLTRIQELLRSGDAGVSRPQAKAPLSTDTFQSRAAVVSVPAGNSIEKMPRYQVFVPERKRPAEALYEAEKTSRQMLALVDLLRSILQIEAPIHIQTLSNRVADVHGLDRAGAHIRQIIEKALSHSSIRKEVSTHNEFIFLSQTKVKPRRPGRGAYPRPIDTIATQELAAAAEWILTTEFGMPRDTLIRETARALGYDRTGNNVEERISKGITLLLKEGRAKEQGEQITLAS